MERHRSKRDIQHALAPVAAVSRALDLDLFANSVEDFDFLIIPD
ncbi:MAG: hypothetical protein O7B81_04840 [Gammaproteobacteria bacterium]|nr:hypothetical protein [Gammaproteobacteria bacterium]MCZ6774019.1 hypothetical protein [Pseudomonadota bacterium]